MLELNQQLLAEANQTKQIQSVSEKQEGIFLIAVAVALFFGLILYFL